MLLASAVPHCWTVCCQCRFRAACGMALTHAVSAKFKNFPVNQKLFRILHYTDTHCKLTNEWGQLRSGTQRELIEPLLA